MTVYEQHYALCIANGCSPRLAEMLASQHPPAAKDTDTQVAAGFKTLHDQVGGTPGYLNKIVANAKRHGYTPSYNDVYNPMLVRRKVGPGDPQAFCKPHEVQSHAKKIAKLRGLPLLNGDDTVVVQGRAQESDPLANRCRLAPDLVNEELRKLAKQTPEIKKLPKKELNALRKQIVEKHGQKPIQ